MFSETIQEQILFDKIYQYLWIKSDTSSPPATLIPETIIIVRNQPMFWYYSDKETGGIRKKKREGVQKQIIKEDWLTKTDKSGVVGYLLHFCENLDLKCISKQKEEYKQTNHIQIIYLDETDFVNFLDSTTVYLPFGILQKFIHPGDEKNSQIQAIWSKKITLFSKRSNKRMLNNRKMNIYERCCTFEGPEYFSDASQVKDFQSQRISDQINNMIHHLDEISYGKLNILQGTFYFKVDKQAKCWFLFCGNLRFEGEPSKVNEMQLDQIGIPATIDNIISVYSQNPVKLEKDLMCLNCQKKDKPSNFRYIPYSYVIEAKELRGPIIYPKDWPKELSQDALKVKLSSQHRKEMSREDYFLNGVTQMPMILERLHNKMNLGCYQQLKDEFQFQNKQVRVCFECYFDLVGLQDQQGLIKVRDNLDYLQFMERQNAKPQFNIQSRVQFLNVRRQQADTKQLKRIQNDHQYYNQQSVVKSSQSQQSLTSKKPIQQYIEKKFEQFQRKSNAFVDTDNKLQNAKSIQVHSSIIRFPKSKCTSQYKSSSDGVPPTTANNNSKHTQSELMNSELPSQHQNVQFVNFQQFASTISKVKSPSLQTKAYNLFDSHQERASRTNPYEQHTQQILQSRNRKR